VARILVLDDEVFVKMALATVLQDAGHTVLEGRQGEAMRRDLTDGDYDLVVTDLNMPVMTGWDVAQWIRQHRPHVPVIAVSGRLARELGTAWTQSFVAFFSKPVSGRRLTAAIDSAIGAPGSKRAVKY
jgi:CheY-like chemotaxis protein